MVWAELTKLISEPKLIKEQAEAWLGKQASEPSASVMLERQLKELGAEEERIAGMLARGYMKEAVYMGNYDDIKKRERKIQAALREARNHHTKQPRFNADELATRATTALLDLQFEDKKLIVRKLVDKIEATQQEVTIWGNIPLTSKVGLYHEDCGTHNTAIPNGQSTSYSGKVGLNNEDRHRRPAERRQIHPF